jgi:hypothetical protein
VFDVLLRLFIIVLSLLIFVVNLFSFYNICYCFVKILFDLKDGPRLKFGPEAIIQFSPLKFFQKDLCQEWSCSTSYLKKWEAIAALRRAATAESFQKNICPPENYFLKNERPKPCFELRSCFWTEKLWCDEELNCEAVSEKYFEPRSEATCLRKKLFCKRPAPKKKYFWAREAVFWNKKLSFEPRSYDVTRSWTVKLCLRNILNREPEPKKIFWAREKIETGSWTEVVFSCPEKPSAARREKLFLSEPEKKNIFEMISCF